MRATVQIIEQGPDNWDVLRRGRSLAIGLASEEAALRVARRRCKGEVAEVERAAGHPETITL